MVLEERRGGGGEEKIGFVEMNRIVLERIGITGWSYSEATLWGRQEA